MNDGQLGGTPFKGGTPWIFGKFLRFFILKTWVIYRVVCGVHHA